MQIKALAGVVAPGLRLVPGKEYDLDDARAQDLINAKLAVAVDVPLSSPQKREKAVRPALETR